MDQKLLSIPSIEEPLLHPLNRGTHSLPAPLLPPDLTPLAPLLMDPAKVPTALTTQKAIQALDTRLLDDPGGGDDEGGGETGPCGGGADES
jgi:hypothetical protein